MTKVRLWLHAATLLFGGLLLATPLAAADAPFAPKPGQGTFLILSDIHFDPFAAPGLAEALFDQPIAQWPAILRQKSPQAFSPLGEDSDFALFSSALKQAATLGQTYDYVLVLGDLLSHDFAQNAVQAFGSTAAAKRFAVQTSRFVASELERRFGQVPVIPAIGNDDGNCGDYGVEPDGGYLEQIAGAWHLFRTDASARKTFAKLGFYSIAHPTVPKQRIVVLNSVFFSDEYDDACRPKDADPGVLALDFLEQQLQRAEQAGDQVSLAMHIPPGFDGYASSNAGACSAVPLWLPAYGERFNALAKRYRRTLVLSFAGHLHTDQFRVFGSDSAEPYLPMHLVPSISPVFYNNPGFTVFLYNRRSGAAVDYAVVFAQLNDAPPNPAWRTEYRFGEAYGFGRVNAKALVALSTRIQPGDALQGQFQANFQVRARQSIPSGLWQAYRCAQTEMTAAAYSACRCPQQAAE